VTARGDRRRQLAAPDSGWWTGRLAAVELQSGQYPGVRQEVARPDLSVLGASIAVKDPGGAR